MGFFTGEAVAVTDMNGHELTEKIRHVPPKDRCFGEGVALLPSKRGGEVVVCGTGQVGRSGPVGLSHRSTGYQ